MTKDITIVGFGSQAKSWALNLKDSGFNVTIALRPGSPSLDSARDHEFKTSEGFELIESQYIAILIPDQQIAGFLKENAQYFSPSKTFILAHGYAEWSSGLKKQYPDHCFHLLAPKAIASELRNRFLKKESLIAAVDFQNHQDLSLILKGLGIANSIPATLEEETIADLFSEQVILCGVIPILARKSMEFLVKKGVPKELAWTECWSEVKLIADAMIEFGPVGFWKLISPNALIGAKKVEHWQNWDDLFERAYKDLESGDFIKQIEECSFDQLRQNVLKEWESSDVQSVWEQLQKEPK